MIGRVRKAEKNFGFVLCALNRKKLFLKINKI